MRDILLFLQFWDPQLLSICWILSMWNINRKPSKGKMPSKSWCLLNFGIYQCTSDTMALLRNWQNVHGQRNTQMDQDLADLNVVFAVSSVYNYASPMILLTSSQSIWLRVLPVLSDIFPTASSTSASNKTQQQRI